MNHSESINGGGHTAEPSVSTSLEHLVAGSQGVITKRIDLALLEGHELLSGTLQRGALVSAGLILAVAAWCIGAAALVLYVLPDVGTMERLAAWAAINGASAVVLMALALTRGRSAARVRQNGTASVSAA